jgi:hypothetical protein
VEWDNSEIPMKDIDLEMQESYHIGNGDVADDALERVKHILDAKYKPANLRKVAKEANHLPEEQQEELHTLLNKYKDLFDGTLGHWNDVELKVKLKPDATPYHARAYPIPHKYVDTLKLELERLCKIGVLKKVNRSKWAAPTFIVPKKDGSVQFISDFRELNKWIKQKPYPIPKIQDMLLKLEGFQFATSLDLNSGYYHIELDPDAKKLCTIVLSPSESTNTNDFQWDCATAQTFSKRKCPNSCVDLSLFEPILMIYWQSRTDRSVIT